jgi:integrase
MNDGQSESKSATEWQNTQFANLVRYTASGTYFARIRVHGKLIRKSLKTDVMTVAKLRLSDLEKTERQSAESTANVKRGKLIFEDAVKIYKERLSGDTHLKQRTRDYYNERIDALLKSWPTLAKMDIRKITSQQCQEWASRNATQCSSSSHNHTLGILRGVFKIAIESGARYDNPGMVVKRVTERTEKVIILPSFETFAKIVETIKSSGSGFSKPASELVEFLAYGGFRIGEAKFVTWRDCDFVRGKITVWGNPDTGLKARQVGERRIVPMIQDMRKLLERMRAERPDESTETPVMRVRECQKSIDRASKLLGIKRITHHDLRHLFATRSIESNVDIPTVSRWLGHKDGGALAMKTYGHLRDEHSQIMAGKVKFSNTPVATNGNQPETASAPPPPSV